MFHTPSAHYDATAKLLHWLMALMIFCLLGLGFYMQGLPLSPQKLQFYSWHKWAGVTVFFLALLRLVRDGGTWAILAGSGARILGGLALAAAGSGGSYRALRS